MVPFAPEAPPSLVVPLPVGPDDALCQRSQLLVRAPGVEHSVVYEVRMATDAVHVTPGHY